MPLELQVAQTSLQKVLKHCQTIHQPKWHLLALVEPEWAYHKGC